MNKKLYDIYMENRVNRDEYIPEYTYADGLLDMTKTLSEEMAKLLTDEGRNFGIMISYLSSIFQAYERFYSDATLEEHEIYSKIKFLYKPIILKEYRKLSKRHHLSKADCVIVIIKRITDILLTIPDYPHYQELRTVRKIIMKLFDNIRNNGKNSSLYFMTSQIKKYLDLGLVGKGVMPLFVLDEEEYKKSPVPLEGSGVRINEETCITGSIVWKEE